MESDYSTEISSGDSPLQQTVKILMSRVIPPKMVSVACRFIPQVNEMFEVMKDPEKLHAYVREAVDKLEEVLRFDNEHGIGNSYNAAISESIRSWDNGNREVNVGRGNDASVPNEVQHAEPENKNFDRGYKAKMESTQTLEWDTDDL